MGSGGGSDQHFRLRWNNFYSNIATSFELLREHEEFVDVTLACEGRTIQAHKVILSACSPYFKSLLKQNPCQHPIIILRDVAFADVSALLSFVYAGEVYVSQERLTEFLHTAELLHIKGLSDQQYVQNGVPVSLLARPSVGGPHTHMGATAPHQPPPQISHPAARGVVRSPSPSPSHPLSSPSPPQQHPPYMPPHVPPLPPSHLHVSSPPPKKRRTLAASSPHHLPPPVAYPSSSPSCTPKLESPTLAAALTAPRPSLSPPQASPNAPSPINVDVKEERPDSPPPPTHESHFSSAEATATAVNLTTTSISTASSSPPIAPPPSTTTSNSILRQRILGDPQYPPPLPPDEESSTETNDGLPPSSLTNSAAALLRRQQFIAAAAAGYSSGGPPGNTATTQPADMQQPDSLNVTGGEAAPGRHRWRCMQPRVCPFCWKTFSNSFNLKQHVVNVHTVGEGLECTLCHKTVKNKWYLRKHHVTAHGAPLKRGKHASQIQNNSSPSTSVPPNHYACQETPNMEGGGRSLETKPRYENTMDPQMIDKYTHQQHIASLRINTCSGPSQNYPYSNMSDKHRNSVVALTAIPQANSLPTSAGVDVLSRPS